MPPLVLVPGDKVSDRQVTKKELPRVDHGRYRLGIPPCAAARYRSQWSLQPLDHGDRITGSVEGHLVQKVRIKSKPRPPILTRSS